MNSTLEALDLPASFRCRPIAWYAGQNEGLPDPGPDPFELVEPDEISLRDRLVEALHYYRDVLGLTVFPVVGKRPFKGFRWGGRFTRKRVDKLVRDPRCTGLALVLGMRSNDIVCRDFDTEESGEAWAEINALHADILPRTKTSRGMHFFFRCAGVGVEKFVDGELRGNGGYVLLPPSIHPDGPVYQEINELNRFIPVLNPEIFRGVPLESSARPDERPNSDSVKKSAIPSQKPTKERKRNTVSICYSPVSLSLSSSPSEYVDLESGHVSLEATFTVRDMSRIDREIERTLPTGYGQRFHRLWDFARSLKGCLSHEPSIEEIRAFGARWHARALPYIRTKPIDETVRQFEDAWGNALPSRGEFLRLAVSDAKADDRPTGMRGRADSVARIFRAMSQLHDGESFFVDCRRLGAAVGVHHSNAWRAIRRLEEKGLIRVIDRGSRKPEDKRAGEYVWTGPV